VIGGGIAAYKALDLIRRFRERGAEVRCILTAGAQQFVTPLAAAALSGSKAHISLWEDEAEIGHIRLARDADLVVVAPATANLMAKMAGGHADDLASTVLLATTLPILVAPAMNVQMWQNPATQRNVARLAADGVTILGPGSGELACNEFGDGRMLEAEDLFAAITALRQPKHLAGKRVLVTAGPTFEAIDPVRGITNSSSGKMGFAIAQAAAERRENLARRTKRGS
jgi:phosphopantothenoylcysteine decarboxylase/phosphopantothenate--cysteine ligase